MRSHLGWLKAADVLCATSGQCRFEQHLPQQFDRGETRPGEGQDSKNCRTEPMDICRCRRCATVELRDPEMVCSWRVTGRVAISRSRSWQEDCEPIAATYGVRKAMSIFSVSRHDCARDVQPYQSGRNGWEGDVAEARDLVGPIATKSSRKNRLNRPRSLAAKGGAP